MADPTPTATTTDGTVPVPVPPGTTTAGSIKQITIRRKSPEIPAACYDGANAVQVAGWLIGRGQPCNLAMQPGTPPVLVAPDGSPVKLGWVLPNLEVVSDQELSALYEQVVAE